MNNNRIWWGAVLRALGQRSVCQGRIVVEMFVLWGKKWQWILYNPSSFLALFIEKICPRSVFTFHRIMTESGIWLESLELIYHPHKEQANRHTCNWTNVAQILHLMFLQCQLVFYAALIRKSLVADANPNFCLCQSWLCLREKLSIFIFVCFHHC